MKDKKGHFILGSTKNRNKIYLKEGWNLKPNLQNEFCTFDADPVGGGCDQPACWILYSISSHPSDGREICGYSFYCPRHKREEEAWLALQEKEIQ
jgi:hypothetical protein